MKFDGKVLALCLLLGSGCACADQMVDDVGHVDLPTHAELACRRTEAGLTDKSHARDIAITWVSYATRQSVESTIDFYRNRFKGAGVNAGGGVIWHRSDDIDYAVIAPSDDSELLQCLADRTDIHAVILVSRMRSVPRSEQ